MTQHRQSCSPSGVPPMPIMMSAAAPALATSMAAATSPSDMSLMRQPVSRHSLMMASCLGRSRMTTVTSPMPRPGVQNRLVCMVPGLTSCRHKWSTDRATPCQLLTCKWESSMVAHPVPLRLPGCCCACCDSMTPRVGSQKARPPAAARQQMTSVNCGVHVIKILCAVNCRTSQDLQAPFPCTCRARGRTARRAPPRR